MYIVYTPKHPKTSVHPFSNYFQQVNMMITGDFPFSSMHFHELVLILWPFPRNFRLSEAGAGGCGYRCHRTDDPSQHQGGQFFSGAIWGWYRSNLGMVVDLCGFFLKDFFFQVQYGLLIFIVSWGWCIEK